MDQRLSWTALIAGTKQRLAPPDGLNTWKASALILNEYSAKILVSTSGKPVTANEIARANDIPEAATYRLLRLLEVYGFITRRERILTRKGKRAWTYGSSLRAVTVHFKGSLRARFEFEDGTVKEYDG